MPQTNCTKIVWNWSRLFCTWSGDPHALRANICACILLRAIGLTVRHKRFNHPITHKDFHSPAEPAQLHTRTHTQHIYTQRIKRNKISLFCHSHFTFSLVPHRPSITPRLALPVSFPLSSSLFYSRPVWRSCNWFSSVYSFFSPGFETWEADKSHTTPPPAHTAAPPPPHAAPLAPAVSVRPGLTFLQYSWRSATWP